MAMPIVLAECEGDNFHKRDEISISKTVLVLSSPVVGREFLSNCSIVSLFPLSLPTVTPNYSSRPTIRGESEPCESPVPSPRLFHSALNTQRERPRERQQVRTPGRSAR